MSGGEEDAENKRRYLRWSGELQEAYLDALEQCGGLHEARPKALLDLLQPRFSFLTLQTVKNHLQKQRTKEARGGAGAVSGQRTSRAAASSGQEDSDDAELMDSQGGGTAGGTAGGVSSRRPDSPAAAAGPSRAAAAAAAAAVDAGPASRGAPSLWLPDSWAAPMQTEGGGATVQPNSLIDLARRALALMVHQLGLYRKLLEELEQQERDHTLLVSALREDPTGQSVVLEAQRAAAGGGAAAATQSTGTANTSGGSSSSEEARPLRLRRLLARLLPPNPFSSGPKAEAALKLAAWIAAVTRDPGANASTLSAGSHLNGPAAAAQRAVSGPLGGLPHGLGAAAGSLPASAVASGLLGQAGGTAGTARPAGGSDDEDEAGGAAPQPHRQRRKRHKPLSELLAEIPLQEPLPADRLAMQDAVPTAAELQQLLQQGGPGAPPAAAPAPPPLGPAGFAALGAGAATVGGAANDSLGPALSLLLRQHMQQQAVGMPGGAAQQQMDLDDDALMLRALDAQMSSLLLQSVSNALMRSAQEGEGVPMDATAATGLQPPLSAGFDTAPVGGLPGAGPGAASVFAAATAGGDLQLPAAFQAAAAGLADDPLPTGTLDVSVLRSFLDMLSSGGLSPLASAGLPNLAGMPADGAPGAGAVLPLSMAATAAAAGQPLSVGAAAGDLGGSGGSAGSGGSGRAIGGGAFSAFQPTGSGGAPAHGQ